jgi:hypothetical protein
VGPPAALRLATRDPWHARASCLAR